MRIEDAANHPEVWEKAIRKLRGRLMPPPGSPQPEQAAIDSFVGWLENTLDAHSTGPRAGHVPIHRLNRTEYAAAVNALLGVEVAPDVLPQDIALDGFDNIAAVLSVSPAFVDQYVNAARSIAKKAVGGPILESLKYTVAENSGREAMPLGLREGIRFKHYFPADGEYRFDALFAGRTISVYSWNLENESTLVIMVDGKVMFRKSIGGIDDLMLVNLQAGDGRAKIVERFTKIPIRVQAGVREVVVGFMERAQLESRGDFQDNQFDDGYPRLGDIEIAGPYDWTGVSSPSRKLIYVCESDTVGEAACARQIAENLATRAFRRPATERDLARLLPFYEVGRREAQARQPAASSREGQARQPAASSREAQARQPAASSNEGGNFDLGVERLVTAVLLSPDFLYRSIHTSKETVPLSDLELASRLSFFIWNVGPDKELLDLAAANRLREPGALEAQARRMLADPKASSLVNGFVMKWLQLNELQTVVPESTIFPEFNDRLRQDFSKEVELFIESILRADRSILELLRADHTFLNDRLARHYGIAGVTGSQFRKFTLTEGARFGLLGKAAVLMKTSYGDRTSPVLRGAWVLDKLLGTPPAPPPPNVEAFPDTPKGEKPRTVRARLEQHRAQPSCRQCHGVIDPLGLALENFDVIGRWRLMDRAAEAPIDASTVLPNGVAIVGPVELREQLLSKPTMFAQALTEKLLMYAIGRELEYFDMPQVRGVVRNSAKDDYKWSSIVLGVVQTDAFRMQGPVPAPKPGGTNAVGANK
jgi:hypothetical protein